MGDQLDAIYGSENKLRIAYEQMRKNYEELHIAKNDLEREKLIL